MQPTVLHNLPKFACTLLWVATQSLISCLKPKTFRLFKKLFITCLPLGSGQLQQKANSKTICIANTPVDTTIKVKTCWNAWTKPQISCVYFSNYCLCYEHPGFRQKAETGTEASAMTRSPLSTSKCPHFAYRSTLPIEATHKNCCYIMPWLRLKGGGDWKAKLGLLMGVNV